MSKKKKGPQYLPSPMNTRMLNYSEYYMSATEKLMYFLGIFAIGGFAGYIFYGGLFKVDGEATMATHISNLIVFALVGGIALKIFLPMMVKRLKEKRAKKLQKQFLDMLECLAASLSSGNTVAEAFANAYRDLQNQYAPGEMIIVELEEILMGVNNGHTLEEMLNAFGERSCNEDIQNFSNVISNCYRLGGNFGTVVRRTRDIISDKMAIQDEIDTKLTSNKLQLNGMCLMPVLLVTLLKLSSSDFANNLASIKGVFVTTIAIGIFVGAYAWGRKIINIR